MAQEGFQPLLGLVGKQEGKEAAGLQGELVEEATGKKDDQQGELELHQHVYYSLLDCSLPARNLQLVDTSDFSNDKFFPATLSEKSPPNLPIQQH